MKHKFLTIIGFAALLTMASCGEDFLYIAPEGSIDQTALTNEQGVELLVTHVYANLHENNWGASVFNWTFGGMYGGDANKGSDASDQSVLNEVEIYNTTSTNSYLGDKWGWVYKGSKRAALTLQVAENATDMSESQKTIRKAEVYGLRAMFYFEGVKVFGPYIPYLDESETENDPKKHNDQDIYQYIHADVDKAIAGLPETHSQPGRINSWAMKVLKAKIFLQQGNMAAAKPLLADALANGKTTFGKPYALADDINQNWDAFRDNTSPESVWEIQFSVDNTNNNANTGMSLCYPHNAPPGGCCGFYQPSFELANSYTVDANGLPYLNGEYRSRSSFTSISGGVVSVDNSVAIDPRIDHTMGRDGIPYKDWGDAVIGWVRDVMNGGIFLPKKHVYTLEMSDALLGSPSRSDGWAPGSAMNIQYLSVRDLMLMYAECLANDGELAAAMNLVNQIRARAALDVNIIKKDGAPAANYKIAQYPESHAAFSNKDVCVKAVRMERKLELGMEGLRWFDLVRWGGDYMAQELAAYVAYERNYISKFERASTLPATKTMFPLPDTQVQTMGKDENGNLYLVQPAPWQ